MKVFFLAKNLRINNGGENPIVLNCWGMNSTTKYNRMVHQFSDETIIQSKKTLQAPA